MVFCVGTRSCEDDAGIVLLASILQNDVAFQRNGKFLGPCTGARSRARLNPCRNCRLMDLATFSRISFLFILHISSPASAYNQ